MLLIPKYQYCFKPLLIPIGKAALWMDIYHDSYYVLTLHRSSNLSILLDKPAMSFNVLRAVLHISLGVTNLVKEIG
jgi:hypothetical protein